MPEPVSPIPPSSLRRTRALPEPAAAPMAPRPEEAKGPFTFVGLHALLFALALMPGGHLAAGIFMDSGLSVFVASALAGMCFPALLLPTVPTRSRRRLMASATWLRYVFGLPAMAASMLLVQLVAIGTPVPGGADLDALRSLAALLFAGASGVCGLLLVLRDPSQDH